MLVLGFKPHRPDGGATCAVGGDWDVVDELETELAIKGEVVAIGAFEVNRNVKISGAIQHGFYEASRKS